MERFAALTENNRSTKQLEQATFAEFVVWLSNLEEAKSITPPPTSIAARRRPRQK
jgi:hypothetical protein